MREENMIYFCKVDLTFHPAGSDLFLTSERVPTLRVRAEGRREFIDWIKRELRTKYGKRIYDNLDEFFFETSKKARILSWLTVGLLLSGIWIPIIAGHILLGPEIILPKYDWLFLIYFAAFIVSIVLFCITERLQFRILKKAILKEVSKNWD